MPLSDLLLYSMMYLFVPLWLLAGFGDWLFHRATDISTTSGLPESLLHLLLLAEMGLPLLAALFLEINALVLAIMVVGFLIHEATVLCDLRYSARKRTILPGEQMIHSFQELIPLLLLTLVAFLHWDQFTALITLSRDAEFTLEWKHEPLPAGYLAALLAGAVVLVIGPFLEEFWRCWRRRPS